MKYLGRIKMKRPLMVLMVVVTVCLTAVGGIYAWSKLSASVTNNIKTPTVDTEVVEKFDKDSTVDWFDQVEKEVQFKNTGTAPVFLRVSYAEFWKDADGKVISGLKFVSEAVQYSDDDSVNHRAVQANFGRDFKVISNNVITWN